AGCSRAYLGITTEGFLLRVNAVSPSAQLTMCGDGSFSDCFCLEIYPSAGAIGISSIEQVLPPLGVGAANHPHDVTTGVQAERARFAHQAHINLTQQMIPLAMVAGMAACDQVFPG